MVHPPTWRVSPSTCMTPASWGSEFESQFQALHSLQNYFLTNELLAEGAGPWSADELAARVEAVGAGLGSDSLRDMAYVSVRSLTEPKALEVAVESLAAIVAAPRFEAGAIERVRNARLVSLRQQEQSAGSVARRAKVCVS